MKIPLSYQVTTFDCGSASLLNSISYLLEREEIPAELIKMISIYTLDKYDVKGNLGNGGTSREAIKLLSRLITEFSKVKGLDLVCEYLEREDVSLTKIKEWVKKQGVGVVRLWQNCEHYVLLTNIDEDYVYLFDPFYLEGDHYKNDAAVEMVLDQPFNYNRMVTIKRFAGQTQKDFALGKKQKREIVLIKRLKK